MTNKHFGEGDATYRALGEFEGISRLVHTFYNIMDSDPTFATISAMHRDNDQDKRDKLIFFLCGWTGGKESYRSHFGRSISMPGAHAHLNIGQDERNQWLGCMQKALAQQDYPDDLKNYLLTALAHPADKIVMVSEKMQALRADKTSN